MTHRFSRTMRMAQLKEQAYETHLRAVSASSEHFAKCERSLARHLRPRGGTRGDSLVSQYLVYIHSLWQVKKARYVTIAEWTGAARRAGKANNIGKASHQKHADAINLWRAITSNETWNLLLLVVVGSFDDGCAAAQESRDPPKRRIDRESRVASTRSAKLVARDMRSCMYDSSMRLHQCITHNAYY